MAITLTKEYQLLAETKLGSFGFGTLYLREYGKYDSQDTSKNTTKYTLKLAIYCDGDYCNSGNCYAYISGTCIQNNTNLTFPTNGEITLGTKTSTVTHNDDGTRGVEEGGSFNCYAGTNGEVNAYFILPKIARYATISQSLNSKTETTAQINWTSNTTIDYLWYSIDNGTNWTGIDITDAKSGTYTISGLTEYTNYKVKTRVRRKDNQLISDSTSLTVITYPYPYCTSTPNFTIGNKLTLTFYNPLGRSISITGIGEDGSTIFTGSTTGKSLIGFNDAESVSKQYKSIPNSESGKYQVQVTYGSITKTSDNGNVYSIKGDEKPTFTNFNYADVNPDTITLTGNNQIIVKNLSDVTITVSTANKAISNYGASIVKYRAVIGSQSGDFAYLDGENVSITFQDVKSSIISVSAIDSRGLETVISQTTQFKEWTEPIFSNIKLERENGVGTTVLLNLLIKYWNNNFGAVDNTMVKFSYRYKKVKDNNYSTFIDITDRMTANEENFENIDEAYLPTSNLAVTPAVFEVGFEYNLQFACVDRSKKVVYSDVIILNSGIPCTAKMKNDDGLYSVGINQLPEKDFALAIKGDLKCDGIYSKNVEKIFENVEEMKKNSKIFVGMMVKTKGFYSENDGGTACYQILKNAVADGYFIHELENGLFAKLIIENNTVNIKQIGARSQSITGAKYDVAEYIDAYISYLDKFEHRFKLYIPSGIWHSSGVTISRYSGFEIVGDEAFNCSRADGTIMTSLNDNQEKVLQIGDTNNYTENWALKNITFSSADFIYNEKNNCFTFGTIKTVTGRLLNLLYANFGLTDNIFFLYAKGQLLKITSSWENYFKLLNFRKVSNHDGSLFCFGTADTTLAEGANISACNFEKIMFESMHGDLIEFEDDCKSLNCHFGVINTEDYACVIDGEKYTIFDDENIKTFDEENATHYSVFKLNGNSSLRGCVVDSLEMNNMSYRYHVYNDNTYVYDTIMTILGTGASFGLSINNIAIAGMNKNMRILKQEEGVKPLASSVLKMGNIVNMSSKSFWFDVKGAMNIVCSDNLKVYSEPKSYIGHEFTPMHEMIVISPTSPRGLLYYDENSYNKLNLCVSPFTSANSKIFSNLIIGGSKIILRAKVPNGENFKLTLINPDSTTNYINLELAGTGNFANYTFDLSSKLKVGDFANFTVSSSNAGTNCLIDCFKFIN